MGVKEGALSAVSAMAAYVARREIEMEDAAGEADPVALGELDRMSAELAALEKGYNELGKDK